MSVGVGDILRITCTLSLGGTNLMQNVFYLQYKSGTAPTDAEIVLDCKNWLDVVYTQVEDHIADDTGLNEVSVSQFIPGTPGTWDDIGSLAGTFVGLAIGEALPDGIALVVRAATGVAKTMARKFIGGFVESAVNAQAWETNVLADALLYLIAWFEGPPDGAREYTSGVFSTRDQDFVPFTEEGAVSDIPGYQRRRKPGVGI